MALWESLKVGFALSDATSATIWACPRYAEILGRSPDQCIGVTMEQITHPDDIKVNRWMLDHARTVGGGFTLRKRYIKADRSIQWVENKVIAFGVSDALPAYLLACRAVADPTGPATGHAPANPYAEYVADMTKQLSQMADEAQLGEAADLLRFTSAMLMDARSKRAP